MKIAIVGSGIAGNVAAYHLHREHDITVFEAGDHVGGHTHTHDIEHEGRRVAVDTGFIVCNDRTYPNFLALLGELGVEVAGERDELLRAKRRTGSSTTAPRSTACSRSGATWCGPRSGA